MENKKIIIVGSKGILPSDLETLKERGVNIVSDYTESPFYDKTKSFLFTNDKVDMPEPYIDQEFIEEVRKHNQTCDKNRKNRKKKNKKTHRK